MTTGEQSGGKHSRDDILAGEYVLGVLPLEKRRELERRMQDDSAFAQLVQRWEAEFSDFNADYEEHVPSATVLERIEQRLFGSKAVNTNGSLWNSASLWRWISVATSATAVAAVVYAAFPEKRQGTAPLVAELATTDSQVNLLASYDAESGRMRIVPVATGKTDEKSLELWLVMDGGKTRSLGVFQPGTNGDLIIPADMRNSITEGTTFAISVEPFGGSPTGQATGPVIAVGTARWG
ncbi:anti-sigma factor [Agrobacterium salinitolerans]|uniref:anti-sigma factor n=1 Tax=Agrobacterium salinitolerans TaxID=1183413 RepID=UPI0009902A47|nr:anti-sigma factor [Agrobacterium salinitolerans]OOO16862.1 anti-sigma factor [Agrobacterium salinitolerans]PNQ20784.1 anti-sigma factor [Rhizobium sp. YIC5082]